MFNTLLFKKGEKRFMTKRIISLLLVICMVVGLMPISVLAQEIAISNMVLDCPFVVHEHSEECYDENGSLVCGQVDYVFHEHDDYCYDSDGNLVCLLDEVEEHIHNLNDCYDENLRLICEYANVDAHQHNYGCFRSEVETSDEPMVINEELESDSAEGFITDVRISELEDGTPDKMSSDSNADLSQVDEKFDDYDGPGNDTGPYNGIVRSFDHIFYTFSGKYNLIDDSKLVTQAELVVTATMNKDITEARFGEFADLTWADKDSLMIEYIDNNDQTVLIEKNDGFYRRNGDVWEKWEDFNVNTIVNNNVCVCTDETCTCDDDDFYDNDSYKSWYKFDGNTESTIVKQRLTCDFTVLPAEGHDSVADMVFEREAIEIQVKAAEHGTTFTPEFKIWVKGNKQNLDKTGNPNINNVIKCEGDLAVTVSAGDSYNLKLLRNAEATYKGWFDFAEGKDIFEGRIPIELSEFSGIDNIEDLLVGLGVPITSGEPKQVDTWKLLEELGKQTINYGKADPSEFKIPVDNNTSVELPSNIKEIFKYYRYGRMQGTAIVLQLDSTISGKGMKGLSLPKGDITFDLNVYTEVSKMGTEGEKITTEDQYMPILWDYSEHRYMGNVVDENNEGTTTYKYKDRVIAIDKNADFGRDFSFSNAPQMDYCPYTAPLNYYYQNYGCYYGGDWSYTGFDKEIDGTMVSVDGSVYPSVYLEKEKINGATEDIILKGSNNAVTTYHFKISDYDFDFNTYTFATKNSANSALISSYMDNVKCFSVGYVQTLSIFPRVDSVSVYYVLGMYAENLSIRRRDGSKIPCVKLEDPNPRLNGLYIAHETLTEDNSNRQQIEIYAPGSATRVNTFNKIYDDGNGTPTRYVHDEYLGTSIYNGITYDCNAYAGDKIAIMGMGGLANNSDYRFTAINILQLFDSEVFTIKRVDPEKRERLTNRPTTSEISDDAVEDAAVSLCYDGQIAADPDNNIKKDEFGEVNYLYAVDPNVHKIYEEYGCDIEGKNINGYDTNLKVMVKDEDGNEKERAVILEYMSTVREETLIYFDTLAELDAYNAENGTNYPCIGVLAEVRNADARCNYTLKIQVDVSGDKEILGETYATLNTIRLWMYMAKEAKQNIFGENSPPSHLDEDYETPTLDTHDEKTGTYVMEVCNCKPKKYKPSEFEPGYYYKTEYDKDTNKVVQFHSGAVMGNSVLIISYKTKVSIHTLKRIKVKEDPETYDYQDSFGHSFDLDKADDVNEREFYHMVYPIIEFPINKVNPDEEPPTTDIAVEVDLDTEFSNNNKKENDIYYGVDPRVSIGKTNKGTVKAALVFSSKSTGAYSKVISTDKDNPTEFTFNSDGKDYTIKVYAVYNEDCTKATFYYSGVPSKSFNLGSLPYIQIGAELNRGGIYLNQKRITAQATISGVGTVPAYSTVFGNLSTTTYRINRQNSAAISKEITNDKMEINGSTHFAIKYSNNSRSTKPITYLFDLLPYNGDKNGSAFEGTVGVNNPTVSYSGFTDAGAGSSYQLFYSTADPADIASCITSTDGNNQFELNNVTISEITNADSEIVSLKVQGSNAENSYVEYLFEEYTDELDENIKASITCIIVKVTDLQAGATCKLEFDMTTNGNNSQESYTNVAYGWNGSDTSTIASNKVSATVISRSISGVVWYDADLDGKRDSDEKGLPNIEARLYAQVETGDPDNVVYKYCRTDIRGTAFGTNGQGAIVTNEDGTYKFENLPAGKYVVRFLSEELNKFKNATIYQAGGVDSQLNSDALLGILAVRTGELGGLYFEIEYADPTKNPDFNTGESYFSKFSNSADYIELHTVESFPSNKSIEEVNNIDLGLVVREEFPETGGPGVILFIFGGALLMIATMVAGLIIFSTKKKQIIK